MTADMNIAVAALKSVLHPYATLLLPADVGVNRYAVNSVADLLESVTTGQDCLLSISRGIAKGQLDAT